MGFRSSILAGNRLVRAAIQSDAYVPGVSGWSINRDGTAEFVGLVLRGDGPEVLVVGPNNGPQVVIGSDGPSGQIEFPTNRPDENAPAAILSVVQNPGAVNESATLEIDGPSMNGASDYISLGLDSQRLNGSSQATFRITRNGSNELVLVERRDTYLHTRVTIDPASTTGTVLDVRGAVGQTGLLFQVQNSGGGGLLVDADGDAELTGALDVGGGLDVGGTLDVVGDVDLNNNVVVGGDADIGGSLNVTEIVTGNELDIATTTFDSYTPNIFNGGTATFGTVDGFYYKIGKLVFAYVYFTVSAPGSGTGNVQFDLPSEVWRGSTNRRQSIPGTVRDGGVAVPGPCTGLIFAGGTGGNVDRIQNSAGADVKGSDLTLNSIWTFQGWYREL